MCYSRRILQNSSLTGTPLLSKRLKVSSLLGERYKKHFWAVRVLLQSSLCGEAGINRRIQCQLSTDFVTDIMGCKTKEKISPVSLGTERSIR